MSRKVKRYLLLIILFISLLCIGYIAEGIIRIYTTFYSKNVSADAILLIPSGATFDNVIDSLREARIMHSENTFLRAAADENYPRKVRPGRYKITAGMTNKQLIRKLKTADQEPVNITIAGHIRNSEKLAAILARTIEADSASIFNALADTQLLASLGYAPETVALIVIPNTYQVYWTVSPELLLQRLHKEMKTFWNDTRTARADAIGLTPNDVAILASIVNEETNMTDEMPRIAGVYINRLHSGMPLQADPTLKYAAGDFTIKRILDRHKNIDSPYNTYKHTGLPPGPVCIPSIAAIDAVLQYEKHDYFYFCANDDFSGYHVFARTLAQHNSNAVRYRRALDRLHLFR
ncbi:MAG: endolytic transglycosylase MltG [Prevotellaceae bacterium]|jgi:UPF0755 protein|nr:endolytic transglycosylase MltG [Prevotellaceae bacterium]